MQRIYSDRSKVVQVELIVVLDRSINALFFLRNYHATIHSKFFKLEIKDERIN